MYLTPLPSFTVIITTHTVPLLKGATMAEDTVPVEVIKHATHFAIKCWTPGFSADQLKIELVDNAKIIITGDTTVVQKGEPKGGESKKDKPVAAESKEEEAETIQEQSMFPSTGFKQEIILPEKCASKEIGVLLRNGILSLTVPRVPETRIPLEIVDISSVPSSGIAAEFI